MVQESNQTAFAIFSVILLIVGFAVAGLLFTFTQVLGGQTYELVEDDLNDIQTYIPANHSSFTASNNTLIAGNGWTLINATMRQGSLHIYNTTGGTIWRENTTDFDINYTDGTVLLNPDDHNTNNSLNGTTMQVVYLWDDGTIRTAIIDGILANFQAQQQIGEYMPIIALAIIITIVISLIIGGIASKFVSPEMGFRGGFDGFGGVL